MSAGHLGSSTEPILSDLRLNVVPEPTDRLAIRVGIAEANEALAELDASNTAELLQTKGDDIRKYIAMSSSRLAPIRRLLPEILSMIFLLLMLDSPLAIGLRHQYPIALVSFHWRAVALSIPSLWSRFSVSLRGSDGAFEMLQCYLRRSRVHPLTIEIRKDADLQRPLHRRMVDHLIQNSERWLRMTIPLDLGLLSLFAPVKGRLPSLEVASFSCPSKTSEEEDSALGEVDVFEIAPRLRSLSLRNAASGEVPLFPLKQLEKVLFTNLSNNTIIQMITQSPDLRSLTCYWHGGAPTFLDVEALPFPSLVTIALSGSCNILQYLTTPNLESISLTDMQHSAAFRMIELLQRSRCSTHSLQLENVWIHGNSLVEMLRAMPTLRTLSIVDGKPNSLTDKAIEALVVDQNDSVVLPALRNLTVRGSYLFRTSTLLDMLESRAGTTNGPKLQNVDLRLDHRQFTAAELERFRTLREAVVGLSLRRMDSPKVCVNVI
ncbi:hypothetical protein DFH06DRAFT_1516 [Mycena polygramma]|nr:hypothetical protein DFH06DRAFT_1516 [Mycena polygramma]